MTDTFRIALIRGIVLSLLTGTAAGLASYQQGGSTEEALVVAASAFVTALLVRFGGEGVLDNSNASQGVVDETKNAGGT